MKNLIILFTIGLIALSVSRSEAQCCSAQIINEEILPNLEVSLLNASGNPVSTLSPGTTYTLRIRATEGTCFISGSGCAGAITPANLFVQFAFGCLVDGGTAPPSRGRDVAPPLYTANIPVTTLTGDNFSPIITVLINAQCNKAGECGLTNNGAPRGFNLPF